MTRFPPEFLDETLRNLSAIFLRSAMIAHRRENAVEHLLHALGRALVPHLSEHRLLRFNDQQRRRRNAAEREPRASYPTAVVAIEHHRRRHRTDVVEPPLGDLVKPHECRQRLRNLDAPDDFATRERGLPVAGEERSKWLHAWSRGSDD